MLGTFGACAVWRVRPFHPSLASWAFGFGVQPVFCFGGSFGGSFLGSFLGLCTSSRTPPVRRRVHPLYVAAYT